MAKDEVGEVPLYRPREWKKPGERVGGAGGMIFSTFFKHNSNINRIEGVLKSYGRRQLDLCTTN